MIKVNDIHKSFGDNHVLKGISTELYEGKTNLIIGKSGSGKTVFVKTLVGLFQPDQGSVFYDDVNFTQLAFEQRKEMRKNIGFLFQGSALFDSLTVEENVRFPLDMFTSFTKKEKDHKVKECLERVNLINAERKYPGEISGGMMKRVGIARAIVLNPKYLFCDEPNSGLDPQNSLIIDNLIQEITREFNIVTIINTHDMNSVMEIGENVIFLNNGFKEWQGNSKEILHTDIKELSDFIFAGKFLHDAADALRKSQ